MHHIKRYDISLPVFIDYEYAQQNGEFVGRLYDASLSKDAAADIINAFVRLSRTQVIKAAFTLRVQPTQPR